jgi:hypothetical protein
MDDSAMRLTLHLTWRSRTVADAALAAYSESRSECAAVAETGIALQLARIQAGDGSC